jgi:hypothetical protein
VLGKIVPTLSKLQRTEIVVSGYTNNATVGPRFQLVPPASSPCRTLGLVAIMPSWSPNWLFIWGMPDQLGLTAADDAKKLQFRMNVFWLKAARIVPKGGPRRDT